MDKEVLKNTFKKVTGLLVILALINSCVPGGGSARSSRSTDSQSSDGSATNNGQGAGTSDGSISGDDYEVIEGKVDLKHIVDPFTATYKTKITLPKNYKEG